MIETYNLKTYSHLYHWPISKEQAFSGIEGTVDYGMPQEWLDLFAEWCQTNRPIVTYDLIRSTTVWLYRGRWSGPCTCCVEVQQAFMAREKELCDSLEYWMDAS